MRAAEDAAWANPSSTHSAGQRARAELDRARAAIAELVGWDARDVVLTSGGTEANNLALRHPFSSGGSGGLVVSRIEHPSVVATAEALAREGVAVAWVDPASDGRVRLADVEAAMERLGQVALVAMMAVNHETGVVQPVAEVAAACRARRVPLHVDAVQAAGKLVPAAWADADSVSIAAHKIRGPKGIGALITRAGKPPRPILRGGAQERGTRPGTQSAALAAGFAVACREALGGPARYAALSPLRDGLESALIALGREVDMEVMRNGDAERVPHVSNLSWRGWRSAELCAALDLEGVAVSAGSACSAGTAEPSAVIAAMLGAERAASAVRISLGETTQPDDLAAALAAWRRVVTRMGARS